MKSLIPSNATQKTVLYLFLFLLLVVFCYMVGYSFREGAETISADIKTWIEAQVPTLSKRQVDTLLNGKSIVDSSFNSKETDGLYSHGIHSPNDLAKVMQANLLSNDELITICKNADLNTAEIATISTAAKSLTVVIDTSGNAAKTA
jgi:hypothetical protein